MKQLTLIGELQGEFWRHAATLASARYTVSIGDTGSRLRWNNLLIVLL